MKFNTTSIRITLWFNRILLGLLALLVLTIPSIMDWYRTVRPLTKEGAFAVMLAFYGCAPLVALALLKLDRVLRNIREGQVFVMENVNSVRLLRWCCLGVSMICLPAAVFYLPLIFMTVIMGFLCFVVNVVCQVLKAAVALREENDLTV